MLQLEAQHNDTLHRQTGPVALHLVPLLTVLAALQSWPLAAAGPVNAAIVLTRASAPWLDALQLQRNFSGKRSVGLSPPSLCVWGWV